MNLKVRIYWEEIKLFVSKYWWILASAILIYFLVVGIKGCNPSIKDVPQHERQIDSLRIVNDSLATIIEDKNYEIKSLENSLNKQRGVTDKVVNQSTQALLELKNKIKEIQDKEQTLTDDEIYNILNNIYNKQ